MPHWTAKNITRWMMLASRWSLQDVHILSSVESKGIVCRQDDHGQCKNLRPIKNINSFKHVSRLAAQDSNTVATWIRNIWNQGQYTEILAWSVVSTILYSILFVSFWYCGELSISYVIVVQKSSSGDGKFKILFSCA